MAKSSGFRRYVRRTLEAGLRVAVNRDSGYVDLLTPEEKRRVLEWTAQVAGRDGFAGAVPEAAGGAPALALADARECARTAEAGGVPVIFPSPLTATLDENSWPGFFRTIAQAVDRFLAFELGAMFNPGGRMFSTRVLTGLMELPECVGLKHSSLDRATELERLALRDRLRPDFVLYTGNDLAADMIEYGSDYLLG